MTDVPDRRKKKSVRSFMGALVTLALLHAVPIGAQAAQMRSFVSKQGIDTNPCSVTLPCRNLQAAMAMTLAGGEIYVLDSAGFGPTVTIDKAVTIIGEGAIAGMTALSVGIMITAGANDVITLRGFDIDGANSGSVGIRFNSGQSLIIQKSSIRGFTNSGIIFAPTAGTSALFISDTTVTNNGSYGIMIAPSGSSAVNGALNRVTVFGNGMTSQGVGIFAYGSNSTGAINIAMTDTVASNNYHGIAAAASALMVRNSTVNNNAIGIRADLGAIVRVGQSTVTANGTGWQATNGGLLQSYGNNNVSGNSIDGTLTSTLALQ